MKKTWDQIYCRKGHTFSSPLSQVDKVLELTEPGKKGRILDLGCGSGMHAISLAKMGYVVRGIDVSSEAIKLARLLARSEHVNARFDVGPINALPYRDDSFDTVVSFRVLNHGTWYTIQDHVREILRVLKPGGLVFFTVQKVVGKKRISGVATYNSMPVKILEPYTYMPLEGKEKGVIHYAFTRESLKRLLEGFENVAIELVYGKELWERYYYISAWCPSFDRTALSQVSKP